MPGPGMLFIGEEEKKELLEVIEGKYLCRYGDESDPNFKAKVWKLEKELIRYSGANYCVAMNSGTMALLVALSALGVGPGDEVLVPGYTFIASIATIIHAKAIPVLCEVDESLNIDPVDIEAKITPRTKAIMPVHMLGNPCDMDAIMAIAKIHDLKVIEDAAQAFGATYKGKMVGTIGDIGIYSFDICKMITGGEGGAVVTNDEGLYKRAFAFHDQGHSPFRLGVEVGNRPFLGLGLRMTELTAAVLLAQLRQLPDILKLVREKKAAFRGLIAGKGDFAFRRLNDPEGECGTLLTVTFPTKAQAAKVAAALGSITIDQSGWHVYNNMEQVLNQLTVTPERCPFTCSHYTGDMKYHKGMLPKTDDILSRSMNISIGVTDKGIGAGFGINPLSDDAEIESRANEFLATVTGAQP